MTSADLAEKKKYKEAGEHIRQTFENILNCKLFPPFSSLPPSFPPDLSHSLEALIVMLVAVSWLEMIFPLAQKVKIELVGIMRN